VKAAEGQVVSRWNPACRRPIRFSIRLGIASACLMLSCAPTAVPVTLEGEVFFNGELVAGGILSLIATDIGGVDTGAAINRGRFKVYAESNLRPGRYRVAIRWAKPTGEKLAEPIYGHSPEIVEQVIPPHFNSESILRLNLVEGRNTAVFYLEAAAATRAADETSGDADGFVAAAKPPQTGREETGVSSATP
jgi:hypothetical protein